MTAGTGRPGPAELERQAIVAAEHGSHLLAATLRRMAETARLSAADAARVHLALHRDTPRAEELSALAGWLDGHGLPLTAAAVRDRLREKILQVRAPVVTPVAPERH